MLWLAGGLLVLLRLVASPSGASAAMAMIFCNDIMGSAIGLTISQINGLRLSDFTTMVLFTMTVQSNGNSTFSDGSTACSGTSFTGPSNWGSLLNQGRAATQATAIFTNVNANCPQKFYRIIG
jgi:hypothetical protein